MGFHIRQFRGKTFTFPEKSKVLSKLREIREWLKDNKSAKTENVIAHLNPIIRGFANFYKPGASSKVLSYFDTEVWKALWKWARKKHNSQDNIKAAGWVKDKYFDTYMGRKWSFFAKTQDRRGKHKSLHICRAGDTYIERHVKIKGTASPDDPNLTKYWANRRTKYGSSYWTDGKLYRVAVRQKWKCVECGEHLFNGEELHTHHIVRVKDGGTNDLNNLVHIHKTCHQHLHSKKKVNSKKQDA